MSDEQENIDTAKRLIKVYKGKESAIAYCEGIIISTEGVIEDFENNSSYAILRDWEGHFKRKIQLFKSVKKIIEDEK